MPFADDPVTPLAPPRVLRAVVMGVAGCGKSVVGQLMARKLGLPLVEGDDFHPPANLAKMRKGIPLTDEDRDGWLHALALQLAGHPEGVVLSCSALKKAYRDILREAANPLYFVHLAISRAESLRRVSRRTGHFYPGSLVDSQFETLQDPDQEANVLTLAADEPLPDELAERAVAWLRAVAAQP